MATSNEPPHSVLQTEFIEFPCTICKTRDQRDVDSHKYCIDCDSNLCPACTKYHTSFPTMASHQVVDVSQAPGAHKPLQPTQQCDLHPGKIIDKYCADHGEVACETCISLHHRNCKQFKYIPKIAQGVSKTNSLQAVKDSTEILIKELKLKRFTKQQALFQLDGEETKTQRDVDALCTRLHQHIDNLAQSESAKIASEFQSKRVAIKKNLKEVDDKIDAAESIRTKLCQAKSDNESELFVYIKQGEKNEKKGNQLIQTLDQSSMRFPKYKLNSTAEKSITEVKSLGEFRKTVEVRLDKEIDMRIGDDIYACNIAGICLLPDASVVISDNNNSKLKHLSPSYKVTSSLGLKHPYDVCYVNKTNEVAVTLIWEGIVQFINVGSNMKKTKSFKVGDICEGIACVDDNLYICCGDPRLSTGANIRVFSLSGKALHTIQYDPSGNAMFLKINYIRASTCGNKLFITGETGIVSLDKKGNLLTASTESKLKTAVGMCTLENGDLLVCSLAANSIVHTSEDGEMLNVVLGITKPSAVCYDCVHSTLIVSNYMDDKLKLYNISIH